jgi:hypothetical protein
MIRCTIARTTPVPENRGQVTFSELLVWIPDWQRAKSRSNFPLATEIHSAPLLSFFPLSIKWDGSGNGARDDFANCPWLRIRD